MLIITLAGGILDGQAEKLQVSASYKIPCSPVQNTGFTLFIPAQYPEKILELILKIWTFN
jgi:hypothetical protein